MNNINQTSIVFLTFILKFDCCCAMLVENKKAKNDFIDSIIVFVFLFDLYTAV